MSRLRHTSNGEKIAIILILVCLSIVCWIIQDKAGDIAAGAIDGILEDAEQRHHEYKEKELERKK